MTALESAVGKRLQCALLRARWSAYLAGANAEITRWVPPPQGLWNGI